ncbi:matrixin family metalloprotease [Patescibacteria group bacterium]|nr:matrixin family metalloprotease [Patescibacteria group bacterium]
MKKILLFASFLIILVVGAKIALPSLINLLSYSFCDQPVSFRIGTVDPRFNLSRETFLSDVKQAAYIWDSAIGKKLFIYDPKGDLSINLVYDERQFLTSRINQLTNQVQSEKQSFKPKVEEYQKLSADFKQKLDNLNQEVEFWNSKGGAPPDEYKKLISQQQDLQTQANNLNAMAQSLNTSADTFNTQIDQLNQTITTFNDALEQRPEEGIYKGPQNRIEIYINTNKSELIHTIAHELGHALGITHVGNKTAIMYPKTTQTLIISNDDLTVLNEACRKYTIIELIQMKFSQLKFNYQNVLKI